MNDQAKRDNTILMVHVPLYTLGPRVNRVKFVTRALEPTWRVLRWPPHAPAKSTGSPFRAGRSAARYVAESLLLDKFEPGCRRNTANIPTDLTGGLLVGFPFSPVAVAASVLAHRDVPYVIDAGDPWALTASNGSSHWLGGGWRQRRAEYRMWDQAAGAILTTQGQADALQQIFPNLPILIRPNGYERMPLPIKHHSEPQPSSTLRLVYYGSFYDTYNPLRVRHLCEHLLRCGHWKGLTFTHYGRDLNGTLATLPSQIHVTQRSPVPWPEVIEQADNYDVALVVGHRDQRKLPSKAIAYLTLPIPRLALCETTKDALAEYVTDKPAYLVTTPDEADLGNQVASHLKHMWTPKELAPPRSEAWDVVAAEVAAFVSERIEAHSSKRLSG